MVNTAAKHYWAKLDMPRLTDYHARVDHIYSPSKHTAFKLSLFNNTDKNPFSDKTNVYIEGKLDLNEYLVANPASTFLIRVTGDSMIKVGINSGDLLVVDRSADPWDGKIVVASINDRLLVKRIRYTDYDIMLFSENKNYPPIRISQEDKFDIWGVVTSVIKTI